MIKIGPSGVTFVLYMSNHRKGQAMTTNPAVLYCGLSLPSGPIQTPPYTSESFGCRFFEIKPSPSPSTSERKRSCYPPQRSEI